MFLIPPAPSYLGLYLQGHKIGYSSTVVVPANWRGQKASREDSTCVIDTGDLGATLRVQIDGQTFRNSDGKILEMKIDTESQGRWQKVDAFFNPIKVHVTIDNSGAKSSRDVSYPKGPILDDASQLIFQSTKPKVCYVLDPTTVTFQPNTVHIVGSKKMKWKGRQVQVTIGQIDSIQGAQKVYLAANGDVVRVEAPMGMVMVPESAKEAMSIPSKYSPDIDLASATCIVPTGRLDDPVHAKSLILVIDGEDLPKIPSEEGQTVIAARSGGVIVIQPNQIGGGTTIAEAAAAKPDDIKPDLDMPSDSAEFRSAVKEIVGSESKVEPAALAIKKWVYDHMQPNAGIGVIRDASEILKSKEGVCRDYAILTCTLLRSAGIPARLASGLVDWDGTFYYHAWNEFWNGHHWVGLDSTTPDQEFSATHVKLAEGAVAQAFTFAVLNKVKIHIVSASG